jgi:hypothetical protein
VLGWGELGGIGGGIVRSQTRAGGGGLGLKAQNRVQRLGFGFAVSNGSGERWGEAVGRCGQGGGGIAHARLSTREGGGARAKKTRKPEN